jgi:hypothetical protein
MLGWRSFKMSDENKINNDDKGPGKNGEFRVPPKTWIVWIVIIGGILALVLFKNNLTPPVDAINPQAFLSLVDSNLVESASINPNPQSAIYDIIGKVKPSVEAKAGAASGSFQVKMLLTDSMGDKLSKIPGVKI